MKRIEADAEIALSGMHSTLATTRRSLPQMTASGDSVGGETERCHMAQATAPLLASTDLAAVEFQLQATVEIDPKPRFRFFHDSELP